MDKPRNRNIAYVGKLFDGYAEPKGKRVLISNGGYQTGQGSPKFGYRCYYDAMSGHIKVQVLSEIKEKLGSELIREYRVKVCRENVDKMLYEIENAILYVEYRDRSVFYVVR